jgi:hypothetical protein
MIIWTNQNQTKSICMPTFDKISARVENAKRSRAFFIRGLRQWDRHCVIITDGNLFKAILSTASAAAKEELEERRSSNNFLTQLLYVKEARRVEFTLAARNIN